MPVGGVNKNPVDAKPAGRQARRSVRRPLGPRCAASKERRWLKCVIKYTGKYVANAASRRTAKIAAESTDTKTVV